MRLLSILILGIILGLVQCYNYCHSDHACHIANRVHFICRLKEQLPPLYNRAQYIQTVPDTYKFRDIVLEIHNYYRDLVAGGRLHPENRTSFPAACRMRELIWDVELAYMARLHAETVSFKHSSCRSVKRFPYVGENLSMIFASETVRSVSSVLNITLRHMFAEYNVVEDPEGLIDYFENTDFPHGIGHFTILVSDRVSRVGCAIAIGKNCMETNIGRNCFFLTCHYDFNNLAGSYVYKDGDPASKCSTWGTTPSSKYDNLCSNNGNIYPINHGE